MSFFDISCTTTIEDNSSIHRYSILHLHDAVGEELIFGHNDYEESDKFVVLEDEASGYRNTSTKNAVNDVFSSHRFNILKAVKNF